MATTTVAAIRDTMITLVKALTPTSLAGDKFRVERAEIDFRQWAEEHLSGCFRRFSIRDSGDSEPADVSNTDVERQVVTLEAVFAYPHNFRYGLDAERDRLDAMEQDQHQLEDAIGMRGYGSFPDASWLRDGSSTSRETGLNVSFLVLRLRYSYHRSV